MNDEEFKKIKNNIKALRQARGESWEQLAIHLGFDNTSSFTNRIFRDNCSNLDDELLTKIAYHFGLTLKDLKNEDYSDLEKESLTGIFLDTEDSPLIGEAIMTMYPIVSSEDALKNTEFSKAFSLHEKYYNNFIKKGKIYQVSEPLFEKIYTHYEDAITAGVEEAVLNQLSLLGIKYYFLWIDAATGVLPENNSIESQKKIDLITGISLAYSALEDNDCKDQLNDFIREYNGHMTELMSIIHDSQRYCGFSYYYLALRYLTGMLDSDLTHYTPDQERSIGDQLMLYFSYIGNKYAIDYCSFFES